MKKTLPAFETDKEAQDFVDAANLAEYDLSGGTVVQFAFEPKSIPMSMPVPPPLPEAEKERARTNGARGTSSASILKRL